jgi:hypothetical protein
MLKAMRMGKIIEALIKTVLNLTEYAIIEKGSTRLRLLPS